MNFQDPSDFAVWGCPSNPFCLRNIQYIAQEEPGNTASYCGTVVGRNPLTKNISANVPDVWVAAIDNTLCTGSFLFHSATSALNGFLTIKILEPNWIEPYYN